MIKNANKKFVFFFCNLSCESMDGMPLARTIERAKMLATNIERDLLGDTWNQCRGSCDWFPVLFIGLLGVLCGAAIVLGKQNWAHILPRLIRAWRATANTLARVIGPIRRFYNNCCNGQGPARQQGTATAAATPSAPSAQELAANAAMARSSSPRTMPKYPKLEKALLNDGADLLSCYSAPQLGARPKMPKGAPQLDPGFISQRAKMVGELAVMQLNHFHQDDLSSSSSTSSHSSVNLTMLNAAGHSPMRRSLRSLQSNTSTIVQRSQSGTYFSCASSMDQDGKGQHEENEEDWN